MLSNREIEILDIICAAHEPVTSTDITNKKRELTQSTVIAVLRKLAAEDMVSVAGVTHSGKVLSRTYVPGKNAKAAVAEHYAMQFETTKHILSGAELKELVDRIL